MKKFSEYLSEQNLLKGDLLVEGFVDIHKDVLVTYRKIASEVRNAAEGEDKKEIASAGTPRLIKLLKKALAASATEKSYFSSEEAQAIMKFLTLVGQDDPDLTEYLTACTATDEDREAWEKAIGIRMAEKKEAPDEREPKEDEDRIVSDDEIPDDDAVKSVEKKNVDKLDNEVRKEASKDASEKAGSTKVVVVVTEEIDGDPISGFVGLTDLKEPKILEAETREEAIATGELKSFRSARDLKKKLESLKAGQKVKLYTFNDHNDPLHLWIKTEV